MHLDPRLRTSVRRPTLGAPFAWCWLLLTSAACGATAVGAGNDSTRPSDAATNPDNESDVMAPVDVGSAEAQLTADARGADTSQTDSQGAPPNSPDGGAYPPLVGGGPCPSNALLCDDFEQYKFIAMNPPLLDELVPNWSQYKFHGYPRVDTSKPHAGKQSATLDTEAGSYRFAAFVHQTPDGVPALPLSHYGRVMVWLKALPKTSQWTIVEVNGRLPGSTTELATYGIGGAGPLVGLSYTERPRHFDADGGISLRAGGPESQAENALAKANCTKNATNDAFPVAKWTCVEWNLDAAKGEMHLWLDGSVSATVDANGRGTACVAPSPADTPWRGPVEFTKIALAWEAYDSDSPQQQVWFDDFAVGEQRIGCPTPP